MRAFAAVSGALAVAAGAFGAHALRDVVTPERLDTWHTAASYQLLHSVVLLALSAQPARPLIPADADPDREAPRSMARPARSGDEGVLEHAEEPRRRPDASGDRGRRAGSRSDGITYRLLAGGIVLFSGSLYALVLLDVPALGAITPLGGVAFILGWLSLARRHAPQSPSQGAA